MQQQLTFKFENKNFYSPYDIVVGDYNAELITLLFMKNDWLFNTLFIHGDSGVGKSLIAKTFIQNQQGIQLNLNDLSSAIINENYKVILIEDLEQMNHEKEVSLFHLYNMAFSKNIKLILTSLYSIEDLNLTLEDLKSRLKGSYIFHLNQPNEDILKIIFFKMLSDKQLILSKGIIDYIFKKVQRDTKTIMQVVSLIEDIIMLEKQTITLKNINKILSNIQ